MIPALTTASCSDSVDFSLARTTALGLEATAFPFKAHTTVDAGNLAPL